ncbi:short transient receptor potential channel 5-like [Amphiura filiformis]|uniref:short transient receptor potential channel 5-like n=1 Tax=Amphiura filiformis TaxID=82378 RepID=UPI003B2247D0
MILVQQLLKHDIQVSNALLKSVDVGFAATVKVICEYAQNLPTNESRIAVLECHGEDQEFHPDVTPIILAAQRNDFTLVQLLLNAGASIPENLKNDSTRASDIFQKSVGLLEIYKGLASEAYVSQKYPDPVDRAFVLSDTLQKLSKSEVSFKSSYLELAETMNRLGTDIISGARSTEEILTVLSHHDHDGDDTDNVNMGPFPKLSRAIQFDQRRAA